MLLHLMKLCAKIARSTIRPYVEYDNSNYWRGRAASDDQAAVLWKNQDFNKLYRKEQKKIIRPYIEALPQQAKILDIGCGIGVVSEMIHDIRPDLNVVGVDFDEMIQVANERIGSNEKITFVSESAESYFVDEQYQMILSSGCYSAIRDLNKMHKALENGANMLAPNGTMMLIDPFHRWKYLARARASSDDVAEFLKPFGLKLIEKSGVLFWPFRELLANEKMSSEAMEARFHQGERLLTKFGRHRFADYKILVFKK